MTLNAMTSERLLAAGLDPEDTERLVRGALDEDLRYGPDLTSAATAAPGARAVAGVVAREPGVLAGLPVAIAVLDAARIPPGTVPGSLGALGALGSEAIRADGDQIDAGTEVLRIRAPLRELLGAERTLLNFLTHLPDLRSAAAMARRYPLARLEASGGLRLEAARAVAQTGVDFVAVGALTHSSPALDLGLDLLDS